MTIERKKTNFENFTIELTTIGLSTGIYRTIMAPLERIKLILQTQNVLKLHEKARFNGLTNALIRIPREQGLLSLWRGNGVNIFKIIPTIFIRLTAYDTIQNLVKNTENKESENIIQKTLNGCLTSLLTIVLLYPLDLIRVRLSTDLTKKYDEKLYTGFFNCVKKIVRNEGFFALYNGLIISIIGLLPSLGSSLVLYELIKKYTLTNNNNNTENLIANWIQFFGIGAIAGTIGQLIAYPFDTIRRRKQIDGTLGAPKMYRNSLDMIKKMIKNEGIKSLYAGMIPNLIKIIPAFAFQFTTYDIIKNKINEVKIYQNIII